MYSLYLDTHASNITICLFKDGKLLKSVIKESVQQHSVYTLPLIKALLEEFNISVRDLSLLLVINGPGSFTGVRIGVTIAKTMAYSLNIPIKVIDSLVIKAIQIDDEEKYVSLVDKHGAFIGSFDKDNKPLTPFKYLNNKDYEVEKEKHNYIEDINLDYEKIFEYSKNIATINPHKANPLYIKNVVVSNDKTS